MRVRRLGERAFWDSIMLARVRDTWTQIDLTTAANLARCQADIEKLQADLDAAGYLVEGKANPLCAILDTLTRRAVALSRALHVHAEATVGKSQDAAKGLKVEAAARVYDDDDLIPGLRVVGR